MQADITESVQSSIRPGELKDFYYAGETNSEKAAYPVVCNTKFVQQFTNLGAGSSQFVVSANQGVSDMVIALTMGTVTGSTTGLCLPNGWGYNMINRLSVRYGSSAQYFWTGQQLLLQNAYDVENSQKAADMLSLGGSFVPASAGAAGFSGANAYLYLKLPHNSIRAAGKPFPFPSDLLVQPIVITVELYAPITAFQVGTGAVTTGIPLQLAAAELQVKQEMMSDNSDLLARRVDMNEHAYTFPLPYFCQQEVTTRIPSGSTTAQSINLTGFRAGEVRSIILWLTNDADLNNGLACNWQPLQNVILTYNGDIFSRFDFGTNGLWALLENSRGAYVPNTIPNLAGTTATSYQSVWTECQFSQVALPSDREVELVHGKPILNAVVNLQVTVPGTSGNTTQAQTLHAMYIYNSSLLCSRGSSEYVF